MERLRFITKREIRSAYCNNNRLIFTSYNNTHVCVTFRCSTHLRVEQLIHDNINTECTDTHSHSAL